MIDTVLGSRYKLIKKIGEGGMAEVYKAKCLLLDRYVAVKILKEEFLSDVQFVEKFKREATSVASLSDNNIVAIYDVGSQGDINYIVMEYVNGKTLKQVIRENKKLSTKKTINISIQIAKALECAHRNNIIHRDIKPHNILVTNGDVIKVTDFGIAKASNSVTITNTSKIMGSAHYFSPEQAKGNFVDFTTDIYSLGIVMYEMITGKVPFDGDSPISIAFKHIQNSVIPPKDINEYISIDLNNIILKSMEKRPINRYQNAKDLLMDLKKVENNENVNIKITDFDVDRTKIMDAIKIGDEHEHFKNNLYNEKTRDENKKNTEPIDNRRKKNIIITAIILLLVVGCTSVYMLFNKYTSDNAAKSIIVPKIVGLNKDEAKRLIEHRKLIFQIGANESSDKPEGIIISCFPKEDTPVRVKTEIRVIVSSGKQKMSVPDLQDINFVVAKDVLNRQGLSVGTVTYEFSNNINKNYVIKQRPRSGTQLQAGSPVDLVVSKGTEIKYSTVPDLNGKNIKKAKKILKEVGIVLEKQNPVETVDKSLDGKIFEQMVESGAQVKQGSSINVSYYIYKEKQDDSENDEENQDKNDKNIDNIDNIDEVLENNKEKKEDNNKKNDINDKSEVENKKDKE